jgi:hypothetical protein
MNGSAAQKLLERMRATRAGWSQKDFERLLTGFGFKPKGKKHDIYIHPRFPDLRISVPRHNSLRDWVAEDAVKVVDELKSRLEKEEKNELGAKNA